jgi:hypothetical protein
MRTVPHRHVEPRGAGGRVANVVNLVRLAPFAEATDR